MYIVIDDLEELRLTAPCEIYFFFLVFYCSRFLFAHWKTVFFFFLSILRTIRKWSSSGECGLTDLVGSYIS